MGISAIVFAVLFVAALVLVQQAPGLGVPDSVYTAFYASGSTSVLVAVGLYIAPLAGVAVLWHLAASRAMFAASGEPMSAIPSGLQFASGVAFVAMLFAGTAAAGAIAVLDTLYSADPLPPPDVARALNATGYLMVFIFGVRFAGMYMITTTTSGQGGRGAAALAGDRRLPGGGGAPGEHDQPPGDPAGAACVAAAGERCRRGAHPPEPQQPGARGKRSERADRHRGDSRQR